MTHSGIDSAASSIDGVMRARKTEKVLRDVTQCSDLSADQQAALRAMLVEMIEAAGWAPFHKVNHQPTHGQGAQASVVPWRFYILDKPACCALLRYLEAQAAASAEDRWRKAWESKVPRLLAGCGALIMVTWLPDPAPEGGAPQLSENNIEHIAAASAAAQNLLLGATARGLHSYWASGGILREAEVLDHLKIPRQQMLLGALYFALPDQPYDQIEVGGLREKRGTPADWSAWVVPD